MGAGGQNSALCTGSGTNLLLTTQSPITEETKQGCRSETNSAGTDRTAENRSQTPTDKGKQTDTGSQTGRSQTTNEQTKAE